MNNSLKTAAAVLAFALGLSACQQNKPQETGETGSAGDTTAATNQPTVGMNNNISKESLGTLADSTEVELYTLRNANGATVQITNYGAIVTSIQMPDKTGKPGEVVLGFDQVQGYLTKDYLASGPYFGAVVGRYGNRIAKGRFSLEGNTYKLAVNNGPNHLHGGLKGFDKRVWTAKPLDSDTITKLHLTYLSKDGEEGYPGNLQVSVTYTLTNNNELRMEYQASTDKPTVVNLTNHSYFNLAQGADPNVLNHQVTLNADRFVAVDETLIPTGDLKPVKGTPFDFTAPHAIGERIGQVEGGYDHTWVFSRNGGSAGGGDGDLFLGARVVAPSTGRVMEVLTDQPGVQFYTGNFLNGTFKGHGGQTYVKHYGFCLETQHFPDSPNQRKFPSVVLRPGETYRTVTVYRFSVQQAQQ
jgi:aldose 1-epimerase